MNDFLKNFAAQFDETPPELISLSTEFKGLGEWSSMTALCVIAMVDEAYGKKLSGDEIKKAKTVQDLYEIIQKK